MNLILVTKEEFEQRTLAHHGVKGQKHGLRQYQNEDGSLTPLGRIHYGIGLGRDRVSNRGKTGIVLGKKQVNSDGSLTKHGKHKVEDTLKDGSFLNPSESEVKNGRAKEREKVAADFKKETQAFRDGLLEKYKDDMDALKKMVDDRDPNSELLTGDRKIWEKFQDKYAEATLKDLKLPVSETNKGAVKDAFKKYDDRYEYSVSNDDRHTDEGKQKEAEIQANREKRFSKDFDEKSTKEIKKDVEQHIKDFNDRTKEAKEERANKAAEEKAQLKKDLSEIRTLSDEELNKRINRLQKEKQYSELLNERANREKGPVYEAVSKQFKELGMKLAQKAIEAIELGTDELIKKAFSRWNENKPKDNSSNNQNNQNQSNNTPGSNGQKFSKGEKSQIRSMAGSGKSIADIAKALGTTEDKVKNYMSAAGITIS